MSSPHRALPLVVLLSCGQAVSDEPVEDSETGAAASASTSGGATTTATTGGTPSASGSTSSADASTGADSSSTASAPDFQDGFVEGAWICEHEGPRVFLRIDSYTSPHMVTGIACVNWNAQEALPPQEWQPCGELSSHPIGGGTHLSLFAEASARGESWVFSADLIYDIGEDAFVGAWNSLATSRGPLNCFRQPASP